MSRRVLFICLAVVSLGLSACGGDKQKTVTQGESEAVYVTLGPMQYQVQLSRQLNQYQSGDRSLLSAKPADVRLGPDDVWFGVWVRVFNRTDQVHKGADRFKIVDTKGTEYAPVPLGPQNSFAYRPALVTNEGEYPPAGSAAANSPTTGAFLLFKLPRQALDFRPLELEFSSSTLPGRASSVTIDV